MAVENTASENSEHRHSPTVTIVWTEWEDTVCGLDEIVGLVDWQREVGAVIEEIRTDLPINGELLSALVPIVTGEECEPKLNGRMMYPRILASDGWALIPESPTDLLATEVACSDAAWLPGGPCEFTQAEIIWALDGFHWVESRGDMENLVIVIGDLGSPEVSLAAAVAASRWFSFDEDGEIVSELDEIPDPYAEDDEDDEDIEYDDDENDEGSGGGSAPERRRATKPYGVLRCVARFNIVDPVRFADGVQRLLPAGVNITRYDRGEATDRFESSDGQCWSAQRPNEMLLLAFQAMPIVGTEFEGSEPRMRAEDMPGWSTVYELVILLDEFELHDPKVRQRWRRPANADAWEPPTLLRQLRALTGATMLQLELRGGIVE